MTVLQPGLESSLNSLSQDISGPPSSVGFTQSTSSIFSSSAATISTQNIAMGLENTSSREDHNVTNLLHPPFQQSSSSSQPQIFPSPTTLEQHPIHSPQTTQQQNILQMIDTSQEHLMEKDNYQPNFKYICFSLFGDKTKDSIFEMHFPEQAGSNSTIYSNFSAPPFIPEAIHPFQRTSNWCYDTLEQNGFKIEEKLISAIKELIIGKDMVDKGLDPSAVLADSFLMMVEALQEARTQRIQAVYGFRAARTLKEEDGDQLLSKRQLETFFGQEGSHLQEENSVQTAAEAPREPAELGAPTNGILEESWRKNKTLSQELVRNRDQENYREGSLSCLEKQRGTRQAVKGSQSRTWFYWIPGAGEGVREVDNGSTGLWNIEEDQVRRCKMPEQTVFREEEEREMETNIGLQTSEQSPEINQVQAGGSQNYRKADGEVRFCNHIGSLSSIFLNPCSRRFHPVFGFQISSRNNSVSMPSIWNEGCPKNLYEDHEFNNKAGENEMESSLHLLSGRCPLSSQGQTEAGANNKGGYGLVLPTWSDGQHREKQTSGKVKIQLSGMEMGFDSVDSGSERRENCLHCSERCPISVRRFASIVGQISAARFIQTEASLHMTNLYQCLMKNVNINGWNGLCRLHYGIIPELTFWISEVRKRKQSTL
ncbi:uncharacterized protein MONOS_12767 [Monocercomonoides exilis]|uniref:uncharacterized protein n=1 Tax=Monocercomonoides exilis TaxID=2049356 RepID=UPI00355A8A58|nr:hypothetical protein MONOS_12767 [Monocercomonoides exilis]|eukprot:MONOS_12767.1-p1 / transcript=MONOS_12767.1 / gene=MONOS_12767 / organism=Monocercomonoides_exilis_PA203 / gene_product=unspecified product / transcript_product=unspecified product / location=Mono_scaffold00730:30312-32392(+) / protein_length=653 / sequence_SO=supercontig / SO=protein_coding / is_pseudo=false